MCVAAQLSCGLPDACDVREVGGSRDGGLPPRSRCSALQSWMGNVVSDVMLFENIPADFLFLPLW